MARACHCGLLPHCIPHAVGWPDGNRHCVSFGGSPQYMARDWDSKGQLIGVGRGCARRGRSVNCFADLTLFRASPEALITSNCNRHGSHVVRSRYSVRRSVFYPHHTRAQISPTIFPSSKRTCSDRPRLTVELQMQCALPRRAMTCADLPRRHQHRIDVSRTVGRPETRLAFNILNDPMVCVGRQGTFLQRSDWIKGHLSLVVCVSSNVRKGKCATTAEV
jgi:hypothetical protein